MSYSFQIAGHTDGDHNGVVRAIAEEAVAKLRSLVHTDGPYLSGSSNDSTGSITFDTPAPGEELSAAATAPAGPPPRASIPAGPGGTGADTGHEAEEAGG